MTAGVSILLVGGGRMGRAILEAALEEPDIHVDGVVLHRPAPEPLPGQPRIFLDLDAGLAAAPAGVVLDFAVAAGTANRLRRVGERGHALVLGTTGLGPDVEPAVAAVSERAAVVIAPNTSPGMALLRRALVGARPPAGLGWDLGIVERHHRGKRDAPSGTARQLDTDLRTTSEAPLPLLSLRQGGVIGEHTVYLAGDDEELVFTHRAFSRRVFARGALLAARFAARARPGRYGMEDVLSEP